MITLPVAIYKDADKAIYGVVVPDVPGVYPVGYSIDEALADTKEAVAAHLECMLDAKLPFDLNNIRSIENLKADPDYSDVLCWALVEIDEKSFSTQQMRFNVSWPEYLLNRVDEYARINHESRSKFLAKAAVKMMDQ